MWPVPNMWLNDIWRYIFRGFFFFEEYFGTIGGKWHISPIGPLYTCHIMPMQKELMLNKKVAKKNWNSQFGKCIVLWNCHHNRVAVYFTPARSQQHAGRGGAHVCLEVWPGVFSVIQQFKNKSAAISGLCCISWWGHHAEPLGDNHLHVSISKGSREALLWWPF